MIRHPVEKTRRQYNRWVATESIEDYALRYSPASFRKWSPLLIANTAIGSISFLALEAIGASLLLSYGYTNAVWAIVFASIVIFGTGLPISYYAARYNIDIDLLTRSAGFGYVGSTITSLIYAFFCFIFFALEAAIMAQALKLYFELPLYLGYLLCSLIIIPIVFYGITAINRLHLWTQPIWLTLMLLPFYFLCTQAPHTLEALTHFKGQLSGSNEFDPYYFGIATGISLSLIAQIGEQVDYLRFMPDKHKGNRLTWWMSLLAAGPGWIVLGCFKQLAGALLASVAVLTGLAYAEAKEPVQMYYIAYTYVFDHPGLALFVSTVFVVTSQIKINVTNAYAGSLAWSNFFSRVTHAHPGRVVWLVFNIGIALLLMEMGVFEALQKVLGLYSNVAIAWIFAVVADLTINKMLKLSPSIVEFKRAHLHDYNPVGFVSMSVASIVSIIAFTGIFGSYAQAYSWLIAMTTSFMLVPIIAKLTKGKYYLARLNEHFENSDRLCHCWICDQQYAEADSAYCPFHESSICSLCCTLDSSCKDQCKPHKISLYRQAVASVLGLVFRRNIAKQTTFRIAQFILISGLMLAVVAITFWLSYSLNNDHMISMNAAEHAATVFNLFFILAALICIAAWWIVLAQESQAIAESELQEQNETLEQEISARKQAEKYEYFRSHILEMVASDSSLPSILEAIVRVLEQLNPAMLCSILLLDDEGKHLVKGIAPSLPDFYNKAINGLKIGHGVGSCGTAAFTGERVIVEDIATHPYWTSYRELADRAGLAACWSQPIKSPLNQVLGTFAIYHHAAHAPVESDIYLIEQSARLASIAIERKQTENALLRSELKFRTLYDSTGDAVIMLTERGFFDCNKAAIKLFGCTTKEELCSYHPADLSPPMQLCGTDSMTLANQYITTAMTNDSITFEWTHKRIDTGQTFMAEVLLSTMLLDGKLVLQATVRDITSRKQTEMELRIAATAFESQEGMMVTDASNNILRVNSAFTAISGYSAEEVVGKNPRIFKSDRHAADFYTDMWESINNTGTWKGEIWNQRKSGEIYPEHLTITVVKDQDCIISNYVATFIDITLSKAAGDKIERLAFYDPLTGLPNRRLLHDRLKPALTSSHRSGRQGALLFLDMDNFKMLNDTLGHDMGDLLLQLVAKRLESCVREGDTVARLGGDEFVVLLEDLSELSLEAATQTKIIGNKILAILNQSYQLATHEYHSTPSIGATLFLGQEQSSEELLKQADIAMYQAKESGRNALRFFDPQMQATITARAALEEDLRLALKDNQFILYYQPQVNHNRQIIGAEVLIRWQHPLRGLVSPVDFIPLAEETHLILSIGQWVLRTACAQIKIWEGSEHTQHLQLAVNVSARQFYQADFVAQVNQTLDHNAINPDKLKLELTESLVLDDIEDTILKMNTLRKVGVRFSMDDFGTGYSSLSSLKKLPLDQLKIDQSFTRDISIDPDDTVIVQTIIAMANKLGIEVIAEGVETEAQRAFLEQHDCLLFQGYLFSKPVTIEQFELLLIEQRQGDYFRVRILPEIL